MDGCCYSLVYLVRSPSEGPTFTCFEIDNVPVDTEQIYEGHCEDIHGNKYEESYTTTSCCECLMYVKIIFEDPNSFIVSSYTCNKFETFKGGILFMWNTSVSDHCCHHCDGVVYKADSVIDTIHHEDECQTTETSLCRILQG